MNELEKRSLFAEFRKTNKNYADSIFHLIGIYQELSYYPTTKQKLECLQSYVEEFDEYGLDEKSYRETVVIASFFKHIAIKYDMIKTRIVSGARDGYHVIYSTNNNFLIKFNFIKNYFLLKHAYYPRRPVIIQYINDLLKAEINHG